MIPAVGCARSRVLILAVLFMACEDSGQVTPLPSPTPSQRPPFSGACFGDWSEIDAAARVFPEDLLRNGTRCLSISYAEERHCPGVYVAIAQGDRLILNTTRYFDGNRQLFAVLWHTDYPAYCNQTSPIKTFGAPPTCPTGEIVTDLCRR